jgi:hypothetical protein
MDKKPDQSTLYERAAVIIQGFVDYNNGCRNCLYCGALIVEAQPMETGHDNDCNGYLAALWLEEWHKTHEHLWRVVASEVITIRWCERCGKSYKMMGEGSFVKWCEIQEESA